MAWRKTIIWTISPHAKQRAWERYGVMFSPQKWIDFCNTLLKEKNSIFLGRDHSGSCRFVCYFQQKWFLIGCNTNGRTGIIATFLPPNALTDEDKNVLRSDERYSKIGNDAWGIGEQTFYTTKQRNILTEMTILPEELPNDFDQIGELLKKAMERR